MTIQGPGILRVVVPDVNAFSFLHALRNEPGSEFGSKNEDVEILLNGFEAQYVRVVVGLEWDSPLPVTADARARVEPPRFVDGETRYYVLPGQPQSQRRHQSDHGSSRGQRWT